MNTWNFIEPYKTAFHYSTRTSNPQPLSPIRIAAFDLDNTCIKTKTGSAFPRDISDWQWWHHSIPSRLRDLVLENYSICIFTNQAGYYNNHSQIQLKLQQIAQELAIPVDIFISTGKDFCRKPMPGMWQYCIHEIFPGSFLADSFYVGDAAGRPADHADFDRKFALNIGIPFFTPEEFFLTSKELLPPLSFDPASFFTKNRCNLNAPLLFQSKSLVLLVGSANYLNQWLKNNPDFAFICSTTAEYCSKCKPKNNQISPSLQAAHPGIPNDNLKELFLNNSLSNNKNLSRQRACPSCGKCDFFQKRQSCIEKTEQLLLQNQSVAVWDGEFGFGKRRRRSPFLSLAADSSIPIYCLILKDSFDESFYLHYYHYESIKGNQITEVTSQQRSELSKSLSNYINSYEEPKEEEGFESVIECGFMTDDEFFKFHFV